MRNLVEIQRFKDSKLALIAIVSLCFIPLGLFAIGWSQMKEYGTQEVWAIAGTTLTTCITTLILLKIKTMVQLDSNKLTYQSRPFFAKHKTISIHDIEEWKIQGHRWIDGLGYHHSMMRKRSYVMTPGKALVIKTRDGRTYKFGINRPGMVARFIKAHWEQNEEMYG